MMPKTNTDMTNEEILKTAVDLAAGRTDMGTVLGVDAALSRLLSGLVRGLQAAGRHEDARVFLDGLLALHPRDPQLQAMRERMH